MRSSKPTAIVILGGAGDLSQRKLLPALFNLFSQKNFGEELSITGVGRTERTQDEYQSLVRDAILTNHKEVNEETLTHFCSKFSYISGSLEESSTYKKLSETTDATANKLFYLAVPPSQYEYIFTNLHESGLSVVDKATDAWARVLIEKPFGSNYETALKLDRLLLSVLEEEQIFRIDHYLAKEAVLNILSFRFANTIFKTAWNRNHIQEVRITMHESLDVGKRGAFYDAVGTLRDVGQNHLLQILALIAMEEPASFEAEFVRTNRATLLKKLIPFTEAKAKTGVIRGQYVGFAETEGVESTSTTETYFELKTFIDDETWDGVPFYICSGKALRSDQVVIEITFHDVHSGPFEPKSHKTVGNKIILTVSPIQSMNVMLNVKKPGYGYQLETNTLSFSWDEDNEKGYTAYEKLILDCINGDQTLFTKTEEMLASWKFITSVLESWHVVPLQQYEKGSTGPHYSLLNRGEETP